MQDRHVAILLTCGVIQDLLDKEDRRKRNAVTVWRHPNDIIDIQQKTIKPEYLRHETNKFEHRGISGI